MRSYILFLKIDAKLIIIFMESTAVTVSAISNRGYKNQVQLRGLTENRGFLTRVGGFRLYSCGFNRQANLKLTPMKALRPYKVNSTTLGCSRLPKLQLPRTRLGS